jgi:hypothetical protein
MPRGDRTGPAGMGAMTGRAAGHCGGHGMPGYMNPAPGRGRGLGRGRSPRGTGAPGGSFGSGGRGWRHWFHATGLPGWMRFGGPAARGQTPDPQVERDLLREQAEAMQSELERIRKRLDQLEASGPREEE